jgi:hypothetical protein
MKAHMCGEVYQASFSPLFSVKWWVRPELVRHTRRRGASSIQAASVHAGKQAYEKSIPSHRLVTTTGRDALPARAPQSR